VYGVPKSWNDGRCRMPRFDHRYSRIWQITLVPHDAMMPSADRSRAVLNQGSGVVD
jgi:hypothetical protein